MLFYSSVVNSPLVVANLVIILVTRWAIIRKQYRYSEERRSTLETYEQRLKEITGGRAPEEGDFNTARLTASDTPPSVRKAILAELQSVEHAVSNQDEYDEMLGSGGPDDSELGYDEPEVGYLWARCGCEWQGSGMYWQGDNNDFQNTKEEILSSHKSEKPDCTLEPSIG